MRKFVSYLLILLLLVGNIHISFGNSQNVRDNNDYFNLDTEEEISYYLNVKKNFIRIGNFNNHKGNCSIDDYNKLMQKAREEILFKSDISGGFKKYEDLIKIVRTFKKTLKTLTPFGIEKEFSLTEDSKFSLDEFKIYRRDGTNPGNEKGTSKEQIDAISNLFGEMIAKAILKDKVKDKEKLKTYTELLKPWIIQSLVQFLKEKEKDKKLNEEISETDYINIIWDIFHDVLLEGIEKGDISEFGYWLDIEISILGYINGEAGVLAEEFKQRGVCLNDIYQFGKEIENNKETTLNDYRYMQSFLGTKYLLYSLYGIKPKEDTSNSKEYYISKIKECSKGYNLELKSKDYLDSFVPLWFNRDLIPENFVREKFDMPYNEYIKQYCGVYIDIGSDEEFQKYKFTNLELNYIAKRNIVNYLHSLSLSSEEKNINSFILSRLSGNIEYNYSNDNYKNVYSKNSNNIYEFLEKRNKENLIDRNCDGISDLLEKNKCKNILGNGTMSERVKYIQSISGSFTKKIETPKVEEDKGFFGKIVGGIKNIVVNTYDYIESGLKKGYKWTKEIFTGENYDDFKAEINNKIHIGKTETPDGKEFKIFYEKNDFLYKNIDGKFSKNYTSIKNLVNDLKDKNPLIKEEYIEENSKNKYIIDNYKGFNITDEKGTKLDKKFNTKDEAIKYIKEINSGCEITIKTFIDPTNNIVNREDGFKYIGKFRIVKFKTLGKCNNGKNSIFINQNSNVNLPEINGTSGYKYGYIDFIEFMGGFRGEEKERLNPIISEKTINIDNGGEISLNTRKDGTYDISMNIEMISITFEGKTNDYESILKDFKYIGKSFNVLSETPKFDLNNVALSRKFWSPTDNYLDKSTSYFDYEKGNIVLVSNGLEKVIVPKVKDSKKKSFNLSGEGNFLEPSQLGVMHSGYKIDKVSNGKIYWLVDGFSDRKNLYAPDGDTIGFEGKDYRATYVTDINTGNTFIEKIEETWSSN